jgi:hypothetical protein
MTPYNPVKFTSVSEKHTASIFVVEGRAKQTKGPVWMFSRKGNVNLHATSFLFVVGRFLNLPED